MGIFGLLTDGGPGGGGSKKPKGPKEDPKIYESHDTPPVFC